MESWFVKIMFDQLQETGVYSISVRLVSSVKDKQPIKSVFTFTSSRDLMAGREIMAMQVLIQVGSVVENSSIFALQQKPKK